MLEVPKEKYQQEEEQLGRVTMESVALHEEGHLWHEILAEVAL